jgi:outer membrane protein assembly factor BamB
MLFGAVLLGACSGESDPQDIGPPEVSIVTETLPEGDEGLAYSVTLQASGGSGAYTWRLEAGEFPNGLQLDAASGTIAGVPTQGRVSTFTIEASDDNAQATPGSRDFSVLVHSAPAITSPAPPGALVGEAYAHALEAEGGRGDYLWSIASGAVPPGISLDPDGSLAGTPTTAGSWTFTLRLTSGPAMTDQDLGIAVCDPPPSSGDPWTGLEPWRGYQRDGAHTGYVPVTLEPCRFAHVWTVDIGAGEVEASQVVTESGVAVATTHTSVGSFRSGEVVALDVTTGGELWRLDIESPGHPGIHDGVAYVTGGRFGDSELVAIDAASGIPTFRTPFQNQLSRHVAPIVAQGLVVAGGTLYGGVSVYDQATGDSVWAVGTAGTPYDWIGPAVTDSSVHVVNTLGSASLQSFDLLTGAVLGDIAGTCNCQGAFPPMLTSPDRAVAAVIWDLTSFDLEGDSIAWVRAAPNSRGRSIASAHGWVFSTADDAVEVVDEATGTLVRAWQPPHDAVGTGTRFVVTDNLLFLVYVGQVHAVDLSTWEEVWHYPVEGEISLSEGMLFIHTTDGRVIAISTTSGA